MNGSKSLTFVKLAAALIFSAVTFKSPVQAQSGFDRSTVKSFLEQRGALPGADLLSDADDEAALLLALSVDKFSENAVVSFTFAEFKKGLACTNDAYSLLENEPEGGLNKDMPQLWPFVVRGSVLLVGNSLGERPVAGFYNPYLDSLLLTYWEPQAKDSDGEHFPYKLSKVVPLTGRAFMENRDSRVNDLHLWNGYSGLLELAYVEAAQKVSKEFERRYPAFSRTKSPVVGESGTAAAEVIGKRALWSMKWVGDAFNSKAPVNYLNEMTAMHEALSKKSESSFASLLPSGNAISASDIFQFDLEFRSNMAPYIVLPNLVIWNNPYQPNAFMAVHYNDGAAPRSVAQLGFFNFDTKFPQTKAKKIASAVELQNGAKLTAQNDAKITPDGNVSETTKSAFMVRMRDLAVQQPSLLESLMRVAFGDRINQKNIEELTAQAQELALPFPQRGIVFLPDSVMGSIVGGYSAKDGGCIYINQQVANDEQMMLKIVTSEWGHHLDVLLGEGDAEGDEGQIFGESIEAGSHLAAGRLAMFKSFDDRVRLRHTDGTTEEMETFFGFSSIKKLASSAVQAVKSAPIVKQVLPVVTKVATTVSSGAQSAYNSVKTIPVVGHLAKAVVGLGQTAAIMAMNNAKIQLRGYSNLAEGIGQIAQGNFSAGFRKVGSFAMTPWRQAVNLGTGLNTATAKLNDVVPGLGTVAMAALTSVPYVGPAVMGLQAAAAIQQGYDQGGVKGAMKSGLIAGIGLGLKGGGPFLKGVGGIVGSATVKNPGLLAKLAGPVANQLTKRGAVTLGSKVAGIGVQKVGPLANAAATRFVNSGIGSRLGTTGLRNLANYGGKFFTAGSVGMKFAKFTGLTPRPPTYANPSNAPGLPGNSAGIVAVNQNRQFGLGGAFRRLFLASRAPQVAPAVRVAAALPAPAAAPTAPGPVVPPPPVPTADATVSATSPFLWRVYEAAPGSIFSSGDGSTINISVIGPNGSTLGNQNFTFGPMLGTITSGVFPGATFLPPGVTNFNINAVSGGASGRASGRFEISTVLSGKANHEYNLAPGQTFNAKILSK